MTKFEKQCREVSEQLDVDVYFFYGETGSDCCEDDGNLHITKRGVRACFDVGGHQDLSGAEQNKRTRAVLEALGMASKIGDRVLVEEVNEEDEGECPHCGRGGC